MLLAHLESADVGVMPCDATEYRVMPMEACVLDTFSDLSDNLAGGKLYCSNSFGDPDEADKGEGGNCLSTASAPHENIGLRSLRRTVRTKRELVASRSCRRDRKYFRGNVTFNIDVWGHDFPCDDHVYEQDDRSIHHTCSHAVRNPELSDRRLARQEKVVVSGCHRRLGIGQDLNVFDQTPTELFPEMHTVSYTHSCLLAAYSYPTKHIQCVL